MSNVNGCVSLKKEKKIFMIPSYGWDLKPLLGGSLVFTTKFAEIPGTHFFKLGRMKG